MPDLHHEITAQTQGHKIIAGTDEVGRGPLAGPVTAAAVIIPEDINPAIKAHLLAHANDSKKLSPTKREDLADIIKTHCPHSIISLPPEDIDRLNIRTASLTAMTQALSTLPQKPHFALIDGNATPPHLTIPSQTIIKGDSISLSIACASILAKTTRDAIMATLHQQYPAYNWAKNKGYPSPEHLQALHTHGVTPHHRTSFAPVAKQLNKANKKEQKTVA